jgi:tetratricopeptide (TPR) repeat protein
LAIKDLERCVEISPDFAMAYVQLGVSHARGGNIDRAIELLEKASQISPTLPDIYNYLGETYIQKLQIPGSGIDLKTVEDMFNKATSLDPTYPMAYINKGNILLQMGNSPNEAIELFKKAVQMAPRSKFAYSHLAQVYMVMQEYEKAIDQLDAAIEYAFSDEELKELYGLRVTTQAQMMAKKLLN